MHSNLAKNAVYNVIYKMLNVLFPLISIALISRALLPIGVGKVSSAQNIVTYFTFLAPLGLASYGTREIAKACESEIDSLFSELLTINTVSTTVCAAVYYLMITIVPYFESERGLYYITGLAIVLNYFNVDWFYQGKEEFRYIALRSTIVKALMLLFILIFIHSPEDYKKYALIHVLAIGGNFIFNIFHIHKYGITIKLKSINVQKHLSALFILLATNIAVELYSLVDTTMLTIMCPAETVAYYSNAMRLVKVAIFVITAIGGVTLPRIMTMLASNRQDDINQLVSNVVKVMLALALPCGVGMMCLSDKVVFVLFGSAFSESIFTVIILSGLFFFLTFSNFLGTQVLVAYKRECDALKATIIGACVNITLNAILIKLYRHNGAAIASVISEFVVLLVMALYSKNLIKVTIEKEFIISSVFGCTVMAICVLLIKNVFENTVISLTTGLLMGVFVYGVVLILFNRSLLTNIRDYIKNK